MEQIVSLAACLTKHNKNVPVTLTANMIRANRTTMNQGVCCQRFLAYHAKKDTLMMIVNTGADIHVVFGRHKKRLYDGKTVRKGAITLDTVEASVLTNVTSKNLTRLFRNVPQDTSVTRAALLHSVLERSMVIPLQTTTLPCLRSALAQKEC